MIIKVLEVFKSFEFEIEKEYKNFVFLRNKNKEKKEYMLIANIDDEKEIITTVENIENYFNNITLDFQDVEKNISALYLLNINDYSKFDAYCNYIYELEESTYGMKRNVLYYTDNELEALNNIFEEEIFIDKIKDVICNNKEFSEFKKSPEDNNLYNICSKLFIKLNCLNYPFEENKDFKYLSTKIKKKIDEKEDLILSYDDIESELYNNTEQNNNIEFYNSLKPFVLNEIEMKIEALIDERVEKYIQKFKGEK